MNKVNQCLLLFLVVLSISCSKESAVSVDENYQGEWHSQNTFETTGGVATEIYFYIGPNKTSRYGFLCEISCTACSCQLLTEGKAEINTSKSKLYIGGGNGHKKVNLNINVAPHLNADGDWECTIEDQVMIRN